MLLSRLVAAIFFVQGVGPLLWLGAWRPGGWFLLATACLYALLASGLWRGRHWALPLALVVTLPQLLTISSSWFSWRFFVAASYGTGIAYAPRVLDMPTFSYHSYGGAFNFGFFGYNPLLLAEFDNDFPQGFVCINGVAALLIGLLVALLIVRRRSYRQPLPNQALQPTAGASGVSAELGSCSRPGGG